MSKNLRVSFRHNRSAWLVFGPAFVALVFTAALAFFSATTSTEAAAATWSGRTETYAGFAGGLERGGYMRILISPVDNPLFNNNMVLLGVNGNNDVGSTGYSQSGTNGGLFIRYGPNFSNVKKIATLEGSEKSFSAAFDNNGDLHVVLAISRFKYYRLDSNLNIIVNGEPILDGDCRPEEIRCEYPSLVYHSGQNRLFMAYNEYKQRGIIPDNWHNVVAVNVAPGNPFQGVSNGTQISDSSTYRPRVPYLTATPDGNLYMGIYQRDQLNTANLFYITPNGSGGWNKSAFIRNGISNVRIATDRNGSGHFFFARTCGSSTDDGLGRVVYDRVNSKWQDLGCVNGSVSNDRVMNLAALDTNGQTMWVAVQTGLSKIRYLYSDNNGQTWQPGSLGSSETLISDEFQFGDSESISMVYGNGKIVVNTKHANFKNETRVPNGGNIVFWETIVGETTPPPPPGNPTPPTPSPTTTPAPNVPKLEVESVAGNSVKLKWSATAGEVLGYEIERIELFERKVTTLIVKGATGLTDDTGTPDDIYYYRVRAKIKNGDTETYTDYSNEVMVGTQPGDPRPLNVVIFGSTSALLSWSDHSRIEDGVNISLSPAGGAPLVSESVPSNQTSYLFSKLSPETRYTARVEVFAAGKVSVAATIEFTTAPVAPSNLAISAANTDTVNLSWQDNSEGDNNFVIERKDGANGVYSPVAIIKGTAGKGTRTYTDSNRDLQASSTNFMPGKTYSYRIRAVNDTSGYSDYSNETNATP